MRSGSQKPMEEIMCDYSLEHYRSRPAQLGEKYETHQFESRSIGFFESRSIGFSDLWGGFA